MCLRISGSLLFAFLWRWGNHSSPRLCSGAVRLGDATEVKGLQLGQVADDVLLVAHVALYVVAMESEGLQSDETGQFVNLGDPANDVAVQVEHCQVGQLQDTLWGHTLVSLSPIIMLPQSLLYACPNSIKA